MLGTADSLERPKRVYLDTCRLISLCDCRDANARRLMRAFQTGELVLVVSPVNATDLRQGNQAQQRRLAQQVDSLPTVAFLPFHTVLQLAEFYVAFQRLHHPDEPMLDCVKATFEETARYLAERCPIPELKKHAKQCKGICTLEDVLGVRVQHVVEGHVLSEQHMAECFRPIVDVQRQHILPGVVPSRMDDSVLVKTVFDRDYRDQLSNCVDTERFDEIALDWCPTTRVVRRLFANRYMFDLKVKATDYADLLHAYAIPHIDYFVAERGLADGLRRDPQVEPIRNAPRKVFAGIGEFCQATGIA